jgi:indolepyruvate ferredoxin oxidoreductase, alpha subunit
MTNLVTHKKGGIQALLQGNQAIARGALEGGVSFCAAYPGNPSSEILETLAEAAKDLPIYVEWSINEKVALEAATAASFAGLRAIVSMKQNGVNVASDFLTNLSLSGTRGGIVLVSCDDPGGISSTNEEDARLFAALADIPLLEPSTPSEALEMTKWAFTLSEEIQNVVLLRSVSRLSHTRSNVMLGPLPEFTAKPQIDTSTQFHTFPVVPKHIIRHEKLDKAKKLYEKSAFNHYKGPSAPELLIISCGCAWSYAEEAVDILDLYKKVGILKLATTWPLPDELVKKYIKTCNKILFFEDVDPFLENQVKALAADMMPEFGIKQFYGKASGHTPDSGEQSPEIILRVLRNLFNIAPEIHTEHNGSGKEDNPQAGSIVPQREFGFCPGCPHRSSYYAIKTALSWDGRDGFVSGDIGCYTMGIWPTGFNQVKSVHAMGSGSGLACGYGKLEQFGFDQPVVTVCGDSTFFHSGIPPLINAKFNQADMLLVILDNSATAMTGFQPHPGTGVTAMGDKTDPVDIEELCRALNISVSVADPYEMNRTAKIIYSLIKEKGPRVLILRRTCALVEGRERGFPYQVRVNQDVCLGEDCGCNRYCTRIFRCPGLVWDEENKKAKIDEVICVGCGVCTEVCPSQAIEKEKT